MVPPFMGLKKRLLLRGIRCRAVRTFIGFRLFVGLRLLGCS